MLISRYLQATGFHLIGNFNSLLFFHLAVLMMEEQQSYCSNPEVHKTFFLVLRIF